MSGASGLRQASRNTSCAAGSNPTCTKDDAFTFDPGTVPSRRCWTHGMSVRCCRQSLLQLTVLQQHQIARHLHEHLASSRVLCAAAPLPQPRQHILFPNRAIHLRLADSKQHQYI